MNCVPRLDAHIAYLKFVLEELVIVDLILKSLNIFTQKQILNDHLYTPTCVLCHYYASMQLCSLDLK
jgi:hypothetical protein